MDLQHTRLTLSLISGTVLLTACAGAVISGAGGAYKGNESQEAVVKKCLVGVGTKCLIDIGLIHVDDASRFYIRYPL